MDKIEVSFDEFHFNILNNIKRLRKKSDFSDVTLVSDDYIHFPAHKVVLSACSEYFRRILEQNNQSQPYLCLVGIHSEDLSNILDYVYNGQTSIIKNDLQKFLQVAQQLKLDGLELEELGPLMNEKEDLGYFQIENSFTVAGHGLGSFDETYSSLDSNDSMNELEMEEPINDFTLDFQQSLLPKKEKIEAKGVPLVTNSKNVVEKPPIKHFNQEQENMVLGKIIYESEKGPTILINQSLKNVVEKPTIKYSIHQDKENIEKDNMVLRSLNDPEKDPTTTFINFDSKDTQNMLFVDRRLMSFVEKRGPTEFKCKFCEHYSKKACHSREHIEMNHASGLVYPCVEPECSDVAFGARIELRRHKQRFHNKGATTVKTEFKLEELVSSQKRGKSIKLDMGI